jgi:GNAT superfamily N-acetyltransferase
MMVWSNPWKVLFFSEEQCFQDLCKSELDVHGAVDPGGEVLGFLAAMPLGIGFEPMIEYLCVREDMRGRGVGSALIKHFEDVLFPEADNLYLFVSDINPDAMRLYVRLGYAQIGAMPNFNLIAQTEFLHRKSRRPRQERASRSTSSRRHAG